MAKKPLRIKPRIKPANALAVVRMYTPRERQELILCIVCLRKRVKALPTPNRSSRHYNAFRYDGYTSGRVPKTSYRIHDIVRPDEKLECKDCGYKVRGHVNTEGFDNIDIWWLFRS